MSSPNTYGAPPRHVVVVGAGLAGLSAALRARRNGARVTVVSTGIGGSQLSQGTVDVLGYAPDLVEDPFASIPTLPDGHPYHVIGADPVREAVAEFAAAVGMDAAPDTGRNRRFPTAVGAWRPTYLVPAAMAAGELRRDLQLLVVGIRQLKDFQAEMAAGNLQAGAPPEWGVRVRSALVDLEPRPHESDASALTIARHLDGTDGVARLADAIRPHLRDGDTVAVPAVLGLTRAGVWEELQGLLGVPVCEIPLAPPSVPGMRLNARLTSLLAGAGVRVMLGSSVVGIENEGGAVSAVTVTTAARTMTVTCDAVVLATGGLESGALSIDSYGVVHEGLLDLPLRAVDTDCPIEDDPWEASQEVFRTGVETDGSMRPLDARGEVILHGLFACGSLLAGAVRWDEKSGEGIALGSARVAADAATGVRDGRPVKEGQR